MRATSIAAMQAAVVLMGASVPAESGPMVTTEAGALSGRFDPAAKVASFKGVPFAAPPVGDLRWREPRPVQPWSGVRDATKFGPSPMQRVHGDFLPWTVEYLVQNEVSEDCLYLNIWAPQPIAKGGLPVLVYIPGGAFAEGSGAVAIYDGTNLAKNGLVVVTVNYRLNALGFLAHPELTAESPHHASGNYGLMDQIAALRWVQKNITRFGGDPGRVTVWGQSAGAFSVAALLASPQTRGLFQRAIADSGLSAAGLAVPDLQAGEAEGRKFAAEHHVDTLRQLRALPAAEFVGPNRFRPIVDGWVVPAAPNVINAGEGGMDVPVITGYQANDGLLSLPTIESADDYQRYVASTYGGSAGEFTHLYGAANPKAMREGLLEASRDRQRVAAFLWARQRLRTRQGPAYTYYFDRAVPWPQHPEYGAFHSGELPYFFGNLHVLDRPWEPVDHRLSDLTIAYLKHFAATGNPNAPGLPAWTNVEPSNPQTLGIGDKVRPIPLADPAKQAFWLHYFESPDAARAPVF